MKKIVSLFSLFLSIFIFAWLRYYGESAVYNYHVAYVVEYLFYWGVVVFILSLFAFMLNNAKYKVWFFITILFMVISILFTYSVDENDVLFSGQYVILLLIGLYSFVSIIYFLVQFLKNKKQPSFVE